MQLTQVLYCFDCSYDIVLQLSYSKRCVLCYATRIVRSLTVASDRACNANLMAGISIMRYIYTLQVSRGR